MILVALLLIGLMIFCAFAVDYGSMVYSANRSQAAVDAAALAGVSQLQHGNSYADQQNAVNTAITVARQNGFLINAGNITFNSAGTQIIVTITSKMSGIFGFTGLRNMTRVATASIDPCNTVNRPRVVPLGITIDTYNAYAGDGAANAAQGTGTTRDLVVIRAADTAFGQDSLALFDLRQPNAKSGPHFQGQLDGSLTVTPPVAIDPPELETTLDANMTAYSKFFKDGISPLFQQASGIPWNDTAPTDPQNPWTAVGMKYSEVLANQSPTDSAGNPNPRVISLIVTTGSTQAINGSFNVQVMGFAPVYLQQLYVDQATGDLHLVVGFLPPFFDSSSCGSAPSGTPLTGARRAGLSH